jgi:hypothetical protein
VQSIVETMRENNDPPIKQDRVMGFDSQLAANEWLLENPARAAVGVHFAPSSPTSIDFTLQANTSSKSFRGTIEDPLKLAALPLQVAAQREIVRCGLCVCAVIFKCSVQLCIGVPCTTAFLDSSFPATNPQE